MVAAEQHRQASGGELSINGSVNKLVPGHHLGQMAKSVDRGSPRIGRPGEVANIAHIDIETGDGLGDSSHAQCLRTHARADHAGTDIGRCADQAGPHFLHLFLRTFRRMARARN